ncbi:MAG: amino acid ABC transporter permease [Clostridia bacterium]|nr:amino acid ABC transporter permease [Clostridia bacterium]
MFDEFIKEIQRIFIADNNWKYMFDGLLNTLLIAFLAVIIGTVLGFLVGMVRATYDKNNGKISNHGFANFLFRAANGICKLYLTVIRGTPAMVQLLIIYFVVFASINVDPVVAAIIAFGLNSAAYVAEIVRGGIMAIDNGQFEAGRSLGFNYSQTMMYIILPQAFKNILPALGNEFIVLLKETSVAGYIGVQELTKGGDIIRANTFSAFMPLIAVAIIYLAMVLVLQALVNALERRLRKSDH